MKCVLLVNRNGKLSACPTADQFERDQFETDPAQIIQFDVEVGPKVMAALILARDFIWLVGEGLPDVDPQPGRVYLVIHQGRIWNFK